MEQQNKWITGDNFVMEPPLYFANDHIFNLNFSPINDILTCCQVTGQVKILSYSSNDVTELLNLTHHTDSCRQSIFSPNGLTLATGSKDQSIGIVDCNGKLVHQYKNAHENPINQLSYLNDDILASGDDEGYIRLWDLRSGQKVYSVKEQEDVITDFAVSSDYNYLLSTSIDGTLGVYDLRKPEKSKEKLYALSDNMETDLLSIQLMKNGRFAIVSSSEGVIYIFKWDWFGDCKDRIVGHPESIDSMVKIDENHIITGSEDGFLRGVSIYPNKIEGVIGNHSEDDEHFPIQKISVSHCKRFAASCSHDESIKFYDITKFIKKTSGLINMNDQQIEEYQEQNQVNKKENMDLEDSDDDEDDDDDDDENNMDEESDSDDDKKKRDKRKKGKHASQRQMKGEIQQQKTKQFFKDL